MPSVLAPSAPRTGNRRFAKPNRCPPLTFERTTDLETIRALITEPRCWLRMVNDAAPPRDRFRVKPSTIEYVLATEDERPAALFLLVPPLPEIHFCFDPYTWGRTREIALAFLEWVWKNTPYRRLVGPVPAYNRLARRLAEALGFTQFGVERDAVQKRGRVYDRVMLEIHRS